MSEHGARMCVNTSGVSGVSGEGRAHFLCGEVAENDGAIHTYQRGNYTIKTTDLKIGWLGTVVFDSLQSL